MAIFMIRVVGTLNPLIQGCQVVKILIYIQRRKVRTKLDIMIRLSVQPVYDLHILRPPHARDLMHRTIPRLLSSIVSGTGVT